MAPHLDPLDWTGVAPGPVAYEAACASWPRASKPSPPGGRRELVWLLEHPALYTAGTSAKPADLLEPGRFPVHRTGRGGQFTYHGPGQRVGYVMLDVQRAASATCAPTSRRWRTGSSTRWQRSVSRRETPRRPCRRVGAQQARGRRAARQDRSDRRAAAPLGELARLQPQRGARPEHFAGIVPCGIRDARRDEPCRAGAASATWRPWIAALRRPSSAASARTSRRGRGRCSCSEPCRTLRTRARKKSSADHPVAAGSRRAGSSGRPSPSCAGLRRRRCRAPARPACRARRSRGCRPRSRRRRLPRADTRRLRCR